jgi:hypothetical protein
LHQHHVQVEQPIIDKHQHQDVVHQVVQPHETREELPPVVTSEPAQLPQQPLHSRQYSAFDGNNA